MKTKKKETVVKSFDEKEIRKIVKRVRADYLTLSQSDVEKLGYSADEAHAIAFGFSGHRHFGKAALNALAKESYKLSQTMLDESYNALVERNKQKDLESKKKIAAEVFELKVRVYNYYLASLRTGQFIADFMRNTNAKTAGELAKGVWEINGGNQASRDFIQRMFLCKPKMNALQVVQAYAEASVALIEDMEDDRYLKPHPSWEKFLRDNSTTIWG